MRFWQEEDPSKRLQIMLSARNGGSITPLYAKLLKHYEKQGRLKIMTCSSIEGAVWQPDQDSTPVSDCGTWHIDVRSVLPPSNKQQNQENTYTEKTCSHIKAAYIVSATGAAPKFSEVPFLKNIVLKEKVEEYGGLPFLSEGLQYGRLPLFCTGAFSALQVWLSLILT